MKLDAKDIGNRVKAIRLSEKKSQETFAEIIDTSSRTVSNIENGSVIPTLQTVANIADCFNCSIDVVVGKEKQI